MIGEGGGMTLRLFLLAAVAVGLSAPASAATRTFTITSFDRIRVDGPYRVRLTTGVAPFARATGSAAALDGISIDMTGNTLVVRKSPSSWGGYPGESPGPVDIAIGTHDLSKVWLNGAGSLSIDKATGQSFDLSIHGPGSVSIGQLSVDRLNAGLTGSGSALVGGSAAEVIAIVRGTATFDGAGLTSKNATIGADGTSVVKLTATNTAKVDTQGTATVELGGGPACTVSAEGSATVSGCR
jgi:hypothetical protein